MDALTVIQSIGNDLELSIYDLIDEIKFLKRDLERLNKKMNRKNERTSIEYLEIIESIGTDLKLAVDDLIDQIKLIRRDVEELKSKNAD